LILVLVAKALIFSRSFSRREGFSLSALAAAAALDFMESCV
jgi:hypothetical protein